MATLWREELGTAYDPWSPRTYLSNQEMPLNNNISGKKMSADADLRVSRSGFPRPNYSVTKNKKHGKKMKMNLRNRIFWLIPISTNMEKISSMPVLTVFR